MRHGLMFVAGLLLAISVTSAAQVLDGTAPAGISPTGIAVNPVTNRIYVTNQRSDNVSVIDGATNTLIATVLVESQPEQVLVNPVTNQIYVLNYCGSDSTCTTSTVTVIDGVTNTPITTISLGFLAQASYAMALNNVTNKLYVATRFPGPLYDLVVIDGATYALTLVPLPGSSGIPKVNEVTGVVYVDVCQSPCNGPPYSSLLLAIDGATNSIVNSIAFSGPGSDVAVDPVANRIYATNYAASGSGITVIDGTTNSIITTVTTGGSPAGIAVNSVTHKVYIINGAANIPAQVFVLDGATNTLSTIVVAPDIEAFNDGLVVNPASNQIYFTVEQTKTYTLLLAVIDGATGASTLTNIGAGGSLAVNPITNKLYGDEVDCNCTSIYVVDASTYTTTSVATGTNPYAMAVNPATNQIYAANYSNGDVTVLDGATSATSTVTAGSQPAAVAVNPATNKILVANHGSANVTVIDGTTNATTTVAAGEGPVDIAVNPLTNKAFVANYYGKTVTVIDGASNGTATVAAGSGPRAVAVNPVSNQAYVANYLSDNVTVIDGTSYATSTIGAGTNPRAVAVNPATNQIYVANYGSSNVTVINGANHATTTVNVGTNPIAIAVDPVTNKVYVANFGSANVTVIDGATNATTTVATPNAPAGLAIDIARNKIYVTNSNGRLWLIDGASNTVSIADNNSAFGIAVNPITGLAYAAQHAGAITVVTPSVPAAIPLSTSISAVPDAQSISGLAIFATTNSTPSFTGTVTSTFSPAVLPSSGMYYQLDTLQGPWQKATAATGSGANPATYNFSLSAVPPGVHTLYAYPIYTNGGDAESDYLQDSPEVGNVTAYSFAVFAPTPASMISPVPGSTFSGTSATFTWTPGVLANRYLLYVGTQYRQSNLDFINTTSTSATVTNLPASGGAIFVTLFSLINDEWVAQNYTYTAAGTPSKATLSAPSGGTITGTSATFSWTAGTGVTRYALSVGSSPGATNYFHNQVTSLSQHVTTLPANGSTVWVRVLSLIDGTWEYNDYSFTNP